jgi:hypothetical protein
MTVDVLDGVAVLVRVSVLVWVGDALGVDETTVNCPALTIPLPSGRGST